MRIVKAVVNKPLKGVMIAPHGVKYIRFGLVMVSIHRSFNEHGGMVRLSS